MNDHDVYETFFPVSDFKFTLCNIDVSKYVLPLYVPRETYKSFFAKLFSNCQQTAQLATRTIFSDRGRFISIEFPKWLFNAK